jgi:uncharacterized membrane protein
MFLALLQPLLTVATWVLLAYLNTLFLSIWTFRSAAMGLGDSTAMNAGTMIYGIVGFGLEYLAIRNLRRAVRGLNLMSLASVVTISIALLWSAVAFCLASTGFILFCVGVFYPGQSIFPP